MISIVLPTKNEAKIGDLISLIRRELDKINVSYEVLVIDKSSDDTPKKAELAGAKVFKQKSDGLGEAIKEGLMLSKGDVILVMDADFSHNPIYMHEFLEKIREFDIVVGSRKIPGGKTIGWSFKRKLISGAANFLARYLAGVKISDATSGYRAYRKEVFNKVDLNKLSSKGFEFQIEVLWEALRKGFKIGVVPIVFQDRSFGKSKLSKKDVLRFFKLCLKLWLKRIEKSLKERKI
ncbi:polyprenol monophosphomannose synthase [Candidatus Bathyarchaeota archaeon]|nr:polyprenol monophosphomannose synthase [Candidatus Bathyarchaeota archaeon]